jgi:hypothetical protein
VWKPADLADPQRHDGEVSMRALVLVAAMFVAACSSHEGACAGNSCVCPAQSPCSETCDDLSACDIQCVSGEACDVGCSADQICHVECSTTASCDVDCMGTAECHVTCPASGCTVTNCVGPECVVSCGTLGAATHNGSTATCP